MFKEAWRNCILFASNVVSIFLCTLHISYDGWYYFILICLYLKIVYWNCELLLTFFVVQSTWSYWYLMSMRSGEKTWVGLVIFALQFILFESISASDMAIDNFNTFCRAQTWTMMAHETGLGQHMSQWNVDRTVFEPWWTDGYQL